MQPINPLLKKFLLLLGLFVSGIASAQTTGSFDTNITFMSAPRKLSLYVPTNYDSATKYRLMICLHGLGDNCANYRSALAGSLGWSTYFPNTIFVCPEAVSTTSDFYSPAGGEQIIEESIKYAQSNYHIDSADVILQGFSLGGRAALRYGLDHYAEFKGLLLNTPALQGVKDAVNGHAFYPYTYSNASKIPIYITHGMTDIGYTGPIDSAYYQMALHDGIITKHEIPAMGHNIPVFSKMSDVLKFFDTPDSSDYDAELHYVYINDVNCSTQVPISVLVRNTGKKDATRLVFNYGVSGSMANYTWSGVLKPFQHAVITLPPFTGNDGKNVVLVMMTKQDGNMVLYTQTAQVNVKGLKLPAFEGFEESAFPPNGWTLKAGGDYFDAWFIDSTVKKTGAASIGSVNSLLLSLDNSGRKDEVISPAIDLTSANNPQLSFDVAYNYDRYTRPTTSVDTTLADTLEVLISTDCGSSYHSLYKKGGSQLATFKNPMLNATNIQNAVINPADSNWRTESIDLSKYSGNDNAVVKFRYISGLGGSIYIDNISFAGKSALKETSGPVYKLFPNPASDNVHIISGEQVKSITVADISGREIFTLNNEYATGKDILINTTTLQNGLYIFRIVTGNGTQASKILINR